MATQTIHSKDELKAKYGAVRTCFECGHFMIPTTTECNDYYQVKDVELILKNFPAFVCVDDECATAAYNTQTLLKHTRKARALYDAFGVRVYDCMGEK